MRLRNCSWLIVGVALLFAGCGDSDEDTKKPEPRFLFSIPAASGSLTGSGDADLTLRMTGARKYLTQFTDRPLREAFVVSSVDFAKNFDDYFAKSDPNAVLTFTPTGEKIPVSIVLKIGQPRWNAGSSTWTFPATRIRKKPSGDAAIKPPQIANPRRVNGVTLVIDDSIDNGNQAGLSDIIDNGDQGG
jgi:hypothetical protein